MADPRDRAEREIEAIQNDDSLTDAERHRYIREIEREAGEYEEEMNRRERWENER